MKLNSNPCCKKAGHRRRSGVSRPRPCAWQSHEIFVRATAALLTFPGPLISILHSSSYGRVSGHNRVQFGKVESGAGLADEERCELCHLKNSVDQPYRLQEFDRVGMYPSYSKQAFCSKAYCNTDGIKSIAVQI